MKRAKEKLRGMLGGSSFFTRMMASFMLMLLFPMAIALFNYFYNRSILRNEYAQYQRSLLTQVQLVLDQSMEAAQLYAMDLSYNSEINAYLSGTYASERDKVIAQWETSKHFETLSLTRMAQHQAYLYEYGADKLFSYSGAVRPDASRFFELLPTPELNAGLLVLLADGRYFAQLTSIYDTTNDVSQLVVLHSIPFQSNIPVKGALIMVIDTQALMASVSQEGEFDDGVVGIIDQNGNILAYRGEQSLLGVIAQQDSSGSTGFQGAPYYVTYVGSSHNDWRYVSVQPEQAYLSKLAAARNYSLILVAAMLAIGFIAAYMLSKRNYQPVGQLVAAMKKQAWLEHRQASETEFEYIENSMASLTSSMAQMQDVLSQELPYIQDNMMVQLLENLVVDHVSYQEKLADIGILFPYKCFIVAILHPVSYPADAVEERAVLNLMLRQLVSDYIPATIVHYIVKTEADDFTVILNSGTESFLEETQQHLKDFMVHARTDLNMVVAISVSHVVDGLKDVAHAYYLTDQMQSSRSFANEIGIALLNDRVISTELAISAGELKAPLENFIATSNKEKALELLRSGYERNFTTRAVNIDIARSYFLSIADIAIKGYPASEAGREELWRVYDPIQEILKQETPAGMQKVLLDFIQAIFERLSSQQKSHSHSLISDILAFIDAECSNDNLSLSYVADHFLITPNYLSSFFKENVGETFLNYLTKLRIERAKAYLKDTNATVSEIAGRVGYSSSNTFIRVYKRLEGITPGEYRDSSKNMSSQN